MLSSIIDKIRRSIFGFRRELRLFDTAIKILLAFQFIVNLSVFASFPLLAVHLSKNLSFGPVFIATVITVNLLSSRLLPLLVGAYVDRFKLKFTILASLILRGVGFLVLGLTVSETNLIIGASVLGLGAAVYESAVYGAIGASKEDVREKAFYVNSMALNMGSVIGPAVIFLMPRFESGTPFVISGVVFFVMISAIPFLGSSNKQPANRSYFSSLGTCLSDVRFWRLIVAMVPFWAVYSQLTIYLPLRFSILTGADDLLRIIYVLNAVVGVVVAVAVFNIISSVGWRSLIKLGHIFLAITFLCGIATHYIIGLDSRFLIGYFFVLVVVFTIGETLVLPTSDMAISEISPSGLQSTYFGASAIAWAIGGGIGNYLGAFLADIAYGYIGWVVFSAISVCGLTLFYLLWKPYEYRLETGAAR